MGKDFNTLGRFMQYFVNNKDKSSISEEEGFLIFLRDRCDDLRMRNARRRVLIGKMEALEARGVVVDSLDCLKQHSLEEMSHAWFKDSAEFIKGLDAQDGTFLQDDQCREKSMKHHNRMCGDTEDGNAAVSEFFAEFDALKKEVLLINQRKDDEFDELTKIFSKLETSKTFVKFKKLLTNDLCIENESSYYNPKKSDGGVSIEEKPNFSSHHNDSLNHIGGVSSEAKHATSSSAHLGNDEDVSHLADNMEIDGPNAKDLYINSQHHLHLLIKGLGTKIENLSIDSVLVVPPKVDYPTLRTIKPKYNFDEAKVGSDDDDYMSMFNDEEQPAKSSLNDLELQQEPDIVDVKDGILEQQANVDKGKTTVGVTVEEQPSLGRGWLTDQHLDVWIDLMWSLRPPEADWAIASPHFSTCILNEMMQDYFSSVYMYPLPWIAVEKVYFSVNEPKQHWCLAQLEIRIGVVTFYDSLGWAGGSRRRWWRRMKKATSSSAHLGNDEDVSHLADNMEIDGPNVKDLYINSQHHLHLLIKGLCTKIENLSIDSVLVVPPKVDYPTLRTIKPKYDFDEAKVGSDDDDYMSMFNDEEQPAKSSLNDLELQQEPDIVDVKDGILEQQANADKGKTTVTVPEYMSGLINNKDIPEYRFPWGKRDIVVGRTFWLSLSCLNIGKSGWLTDQHLDVWIDLMWSLRPPKADWAIASPHFSTCILNEMMQDYFSNVYMYPLPWIAVEKVYFPVNEPKQHWCLAQLEIRTGVVTFYDSLGWAGGSRRRWWRRMKK
nr:hypothetical protein [Tanacetum cinerariifolium]